MGWDGMKVGARESVEHCIRREFDDLVDLHIPHPNAAESAAYGAYRSRRGLVVGVVVLFERSGEWVHLKTIDESMGPYYYDCPTRILDQLSPLEAFGCDMSSAKEWREKCRVRAAGGDGRITVRSLKKALKGVI